jgi:hypothetical protein
MDESKMDINEYIPKIRLKNFNIFTVASLLLLIAGLAHYIYWGTRYDVWYDIGIYSITIVLVLGGILGFIISLMDSKK